MTLVTSGQPAPPGAARDSLLTFAKDEDRVSTYKTVGSFPFPGSLKVGLPTRIVAIAGVETASAMDVRVYDVENNQVIAEATGISADYPSRVDLGAIANVTQGPSIWELQYRRASGAGNQTVACSSAVLEY